MSTTFTTMMAFFVIMLFTLSLSASTLAQQQQQQNQVISHKGHCSNATVTQTCCDIMQMRHQALPFYLDNDDCRLKTSKTEYPGLTEKAWRGFRVCCVDLEKDSIDSTI